MFKIARRVNSERRLLKPKVRMLTDILGMVSTVFGAVIYVVIINHYMASTLAEYTHSSPYIFWSLFIIGLLVFYTLGQFFILGIATSILVLAGSLSVTEALNYTFKYKMPCKWFLNDNAQQTTKANG